MFFNIKKDLFKSIERLCRSGKTQVGSEAKKINVLGGLSKKYLTRQILRSYDYPEVFQIVQNRFSNSYRNGQKSIEFIFIFFPLVNVF